MSSNLTVNDVLETNSVTLRISLCSLPVEGTAKRLSGSPLTGIEIEDKELYANRLEGVFAVRRKSLGSALQRFFRSPFRRWEFFCLLLALMFGLPVSSHADHERLHKSPMRDDTGRCKEWLLRLFGLLAGACSQRAAVQTD